MNNRITMEKFAEAVGVTYRTIKRYIDAGKLLPRRTLGGKIYFLDSDIPLYLNHNTSEPLILDGTATNDTENTK